MTRAGLRTDLSGGGIMRRNTAALGLSSALVLFGCGAQDQAEELTASKTTSTSISTTTSTSTTTTSTTTTMVATTVPRTRTTSPPATQVRPQERQGNCSPSYPDFCIPPAPPDLDCADVSGKRFTVLPPDPHGLDGNDDDGVGCER